MFTEQLTEALCTDFRTLHERTLAPVVVAVVDSGIDASHPDIQGRVLAAYSVSGREGEEEVIEQDPEADNDAMGHGTGVAYIIAQMAPNAKLIDVRVLDKQKQSSGAVLLKGLDFAVEKLTHARVINMSLAARDVFASALREPCEKAHQQRQIIVAATRNLPIPDRGCPAGFASCISIENETLPDAFSVCYRFNDMIDFAGHGSDVKIARNGGGYTTATGTSFAAPAITGLTALLLGLYPDLQAFEVKTILKALAVRQER